MVQVILLVWERLDSICAERLTPVLLSTARHLPRLGVLRLSSEVEEQWGHMSRATVARLLNKHRSRKRRLPQKGPQRANQLKREVPMKRIAWDTADAGHFEVDLVSPYLMEKTVVEGAGSSSISGPSAPHHRRTCT